MTRRVLVLIALHVAGGTGLLVAAGDGGPGGIPAVLGYTALFAIVGFIPLHLELRQNTHTITITEAVLVASAFHLPPAGVVLAAVCGELVVCLVTRLRLLRLAFNVAQTFGAAAVAALVFQAFGPVEATMPLGWAAALSAAGAFAVTSMLTVTWVLTLVETSSFKKMVAVAATSVTVTALASAALGLALLILAESAVPAPLLLAPDRGPGGARVEAGDRCIGRATPVPAPVRGVVAGRHDSPASRRPSASSPARLVTSSPVPWPSVAPRPTETGGRAWWWTTTGPALSTMPPSPSWWP